MVLLALAVKLILNTLPGTNVIFIFIFELVRKHEISFHVGETM